MLNEQSNAHLLLSAGNRGSHVDLKLGVVHLLLCLSVLKLQLRGFS